jgi:hypothetical protein
MGDLGGSWCALGRERRGAYAHQCDLKVGTFKSEVWGIAMTEREKLEREVRRLRGIIRTNESALKAAMSASDRVWITKQLGLRQIRLGRLRERLDALQPPRPARPRRPSQ